MRVLPELRGPACAECADRAARTAWSRSQVHPAGQPSIRDRRCRGLRLAQSVHLAPEGQQQRDHYAYRNERGKTIFMHREIMQTPPGKVVDHKNHNPINNRRSNLWNCTSAAEPAQPRPPGNKSGFVGVYPYGKKWLARIRSGGKVVYSQVFDDKVEAAKARDRKVYDLFGAFAYLNFPDEIPAGPATSSAQPVLRYIDLSGSAHACC